MQTDYPYPKSESTNAAIPQRSVGLTPCHDNTFGSPALAAGQGAGCGSASTGEATRVLQGATSRQRQNHDEFVDALRQIDTYRQPLLVDLARGLADRADRLDDLHRPEAAARLRRRSARLGVGLADRWQDAQLNKLEIGNTETGEVRLVCTCRLLVCPTCEAARAARLSRWSAEVVPLHDEVERARGREPVMLTLTVRDSGDASADVALLRRAWPRFYLYLRRTLGVRYYFNAEEITTGRAGQGHVHWHVVTWLEPWVDYSELHRQWWDAIGRVMAKLHPDLETAEVWTAPVPRSFGEAGPRTEVVWRARPDCGGDRQAVCGARPCSRHVPGNVDVQRNGVGGAEVAAAYAGKAGAASTAIARAAYALKGADTDELVAAEPLARYMVGRIAKRRVSVSRAFWRHSDGRDVRRRVGPWCATGNSYPTRADAGVPGWFNAFSGAAPHPPMGLRSMRAAGRGAGAGVEAAVKGAVGAAQPAKPLDGRRDEGTPPGRAGRYTEVCGAAADPCAVGSVTVALLSRRGAESSG